MEKTIHTGRTRLVAFSVGPAEEAEDCYSRADEECECESHLDGGES